MHFHDGTLSQFSYFVFSFLYLPLSNSILHKGPVCGPIFTVHSMSRQSTEYFKYIYHCDSQNLKSRTMPTVFPICIQIYLNILQEPEIKQD